jgi:hypothetical protein
MADSALKQRLLADMKSSMKGGDKPRLAVIRMMLAAIKQIEIDERIELDETRTTSVLDKMAKQRRESITQFEKASRDDLIAIEQSELAIIKEYLPKALSESEIAILIEEAITQTGASDMKQMGQVMGLLKPKLAGRADMSAVSQQIRSMLDAG